MLYNKYVRLLYDSKIKAYKPYFFYEKMFGYNTSVICENNNYILTVDTNESNVHDSVFL